MRVYLLIFFVLLCLFSCNNNKIKKIELEKIDLNIEVKRFDIDFYTSNKESIHLVREKYPYMFPEGFTDKMALSKINDKNEQELFSETQKLYKDFSPIKNQLVELFKHIKHYESKFTPPKIVTILSNIDYDSRIIYADSLLLISLDTYLGKNHKFYADHPNYIKENNTHKNIVVSVANSIIDKKLTSNSTNRTLISKFIFEGKKMYLLDLYLPNISDNLKIGYSQKKLNWAISNEEKVWVYFIERNYLFDTDTRLSKRFIDKAPFSKFYLEIDSQSPGKIGTWIGWQIVKSFMKNNDVSLQKLLEADSEELFKKSKYKPKK